MKLHFNQPLLGWNSRGGWRTVYKKRALHKKVEQHTFSKGGSWPFFFNSRSGLWWLNRSLVGGLADHCITCSKHSHCSYRSVKSERKHFSCFFFFHLPYLGQIHADTEWDRSRYKERLRCTESNKIIADGELRRLSVDCVRCPWEAPRCRDDCAQGNWEAWA